MGHLINPLSFRLGENIFWLSTWNLTNHHKYNNISASDKYILNYVTWYLKKFYNFNFKLKFYKIKIFRTKNKIYLNIFNQYLSKFLESNKNWFAFKPNNSLKISVNFLYKIVLSFFWEIFQKKINFFLNKANNISGLIFKLNIYYSSRDLVSPTLITQNIIRRLNSGFSLPQVINPTVWDLERKLKDSFISGYKLLYAGRFTRKQIATFSWTTRGYLMFNTKTALLDYSCDRTDLKYGTCGIKLWLTYRNKKNYLDGYDLVFPLFKSNFFHRKINLDNLFFCVNTLNIFKNNKIKHYDTFLTWFFKKRLTKNWFNKLKFSKKKNKVFAVDLKSTFFCYTKTSNLEKKTQKKKKISNKILPSFKNIYYWTGNLDYSLLVLIKSNLALKTDKKIDEVLKNPWYISKEKMFFYRVQKKNIIAYI